jgi:hypothetical protein
VPGNTRLPRLEFRQRHCPTRDGDVVRVGRRQMAANEFIEIANVGARLFRQLSFCGSDRHVAAARERSTGGLLDALRHMLEALRSGR